MSIKKFNVFETNKVKGVSKGQNPKEIKSSISSKIVDILNKYYNEDDFEEIEDPEEYAKSISKDISEEIKKRVGDMWHYLDDLEFEYKLEEKITDDITDRVIVFGNNKFFFLCPPDDDPRGVIDTIMYDDGDIKFIDEIVGGVDEYQYK